MDYSRFTTDELEALVAKDYSKLSTENLEYLASQKSTVSKTSLTEDFKIGIAEPLKTLSRAGAGLGSLVLPESGDKYLFDSSKVAQESLDVWANPNKKEQGFSGQATSVLNPIGMAGAIATLPFSPFTTTQQAIDAGENGLSAAKMGLTDTLGNVVGIAAPPFKGAGIAAKMASGAVINAGQDVLSRQAISNMAETEKGKGLFKPTLETTALAAIPGAAIGGIHGAIDNKRTALVTEAQGILKELEAVEQKRGTVSQELITKAIRSADEQTLATEKNLYGIMRTFDKLQEVDPIKAQEFLQTVLPSVKEHIFTIRTDLGSIDKLSTKHPEHGYEFRNKGDLAVNKIIDKFKLTDEEPIVRSENSPVLREEFQWDEATQRPPMDREELIREYAKEENISIEEANRRIAFDEEAKNIAEQIPGEETPLRKFDKDTGELTNIEQFPDLNRPSLKPVEDIRRRNPSEPLEADPWDTRMDTDVYSGRWDGDTPTSKLPEDILFKDIPEEYKPVIERALKTLGLDKELVAFYNKKEGGSQVTYNKDGSYSVGIQARDIPANILAKYPNLSAQQMKKLSTAWSIAHELGHIILFKAIQTDIFNGKALRVALDYKKWFNKNKVPAQQMGAAIALRDFPRYREYYTHFNEFFAQRVAEQLLNPTKHNISRGFVANIKALWKELVISFGLPANTFRAVDDLINDIIVANKKTVEDTGSTLWEMAAVKRTFDQTKSINAVLGSKRYDSSNKATPEEILARAKAGEDEALPISAETGMRILKEIRDIPRTMLNYGFGLQQKRQFFEANEPVQYTIQTIIDATNTQASQVSRLLQGSPQTTTSNKRIWSLKRSEAENSPKVLLGKSTDEDVYAVMKVFQEGFDKWTYSETLQNLGHTMTPHQVKVFKSLATMFTHLSGLAGGYIPKSRKGWFPATRNGNFTVTLHLPGSDRVRAFDNGEPELTTAAYTQTFFSKREAEVFLEWFNNLPANERGDLFTHGVKERDQTPKLDNARLALEEELQTLIDNAPNTRASDLTTLITALFDKYKGKKDALAGHRKLRLSIPGYKGNELTGNIQEQGRSFRDAIFNSVDEYTTYIMKNTLHEKLNPFIDDLEFKNSHPDTYESIKLLKDYATNEISTFLSDTGKAIDVKADYFTDLIREAFMNKVGVKPTYGQTHLTDATLGKLNRLFYIYALIGRPAFWTAQAVQFLWSGRTVAKDGSFFDMITTGGKGLLTAAAQPKDFKDAVNFVKENYHTFHPQFINDLNTFHLLELKEGSISQHTLEILLGEKQSSAADTFSRYMSFAIMYEHYKAQGLSGEALYKKAAEKTDENMVQYGRQYKAPVFQKFGMFGQAVSPLQTFPQAALGNFLADVKHLASTPVGQGKLRASMPALATMIVSMTMAGAIAAPIMAELTVLIEMYNWLAKKMELPTLFSLKDHVLKGNNDFSNRVLSHGMLSASTMAINEEGFDLGSSLRWQPVFVGILQGEKTVMDYLPTLKWYGQQVANVGTITKDGADDSYVDDATVRKAWMDLFPSGPLRGAADNFFYDSNEEKGIYDTKGAMKRENSPMEQLAKFLGTKTITGSTEEQKIFNDKVRTQKQNEIKSVLLKTTVDALQKDDVDTVRENIRKLVTDYKMDFKGIETALNNEYYKREVPQGVRQFVGKQGTVSRTKQIDLYNYMQRYEVNPFTGEETNK